MPIKKKATAEECCAKCESDIAALRTEIAELRAALAKRPAGGADPRVDAVLEILKLHPKHKQILESKGC